MRYDDSLETVLSADMSSPMGAQLAWRQLVDLVGRGRVAASDAVISRLRGLRGAVPPPVRTSSARAVAFASPPLALVLLFAEDEIAVAAPVLRSVHLSAADWAELLPILSPTARSVLRHRRDLGPEVVAMLESFGSVDFVLASPSQDDAARTEAPAFLEGTAAPEEDATSEPSPTADDAGLHAPAAASAPAAEPATGPFEIAELVERINAYQRDRAVGGTGANASIIGQAERFRFETDSAGVIRWVEGVSRSPLIGVTLARTSAALGSDTTDPLTTSVDGAVVGAFRQRAGFADLRLWVEGQSDAAGGWRISAVPVFDRASGRFTGYRGSARRPRVDEAAEHAADERAGVADALRQLVHELRTPTNAIAGFAEMIETELFGPVPAVYREQAAAIRSQTAGLLGAIEDMDIAARIETNALQLFVDDVPVAQLLEWITADLAPLATLRGARFALRVDHPSLSIRGDGQAVERLIGRLLATLVAAGTAGEQIGIVAAATATKQIKVTFDRPRALADYPEDLLLTIDADTDAGEQGAPLLGTGFALRLARNLAAELGGGLAIGPDSLTLHLPATIPADVELISHL
ncbi:histidine kinase dimerization/phospho-acceptor domain-containing protein [Sphingomonas sp. PAMC 26617]|uniref:sensor histidine kinase n=1 Tax=Sphingomonas sp. PAMC 26617 TaxID=1112216 RepID=UPI00031EB405